MHRSSDTIICFCFLVVLSSFAQTKANAQESRTWKDTTGKFSVEAVLTGQDTTSIELKTTDGRTITVPKSKLSRPDRAHLKSLSEAPVLLSAQAVENSITSKLNGPAVGVESEETLPAFLARLEIPTFIDEKSLEEIGLTPDLVLESVLGAKSLGDQIDAMLMTYDMTWYRVRSVLVITTKESAERDAMQILAYQIPVPRGDYTAVKKRISAVEPSSWESLGGPGSIVPLPKAIVIRQSAPVHRGLAKQLGISPVPERYFHPLDERVVSVELSNGTIEEFAKQMQEQIGLQVTVAESIAERGNLTVILKNVTASDALDLMLGQAGGQWLETPKGLELVSVREARKRVEQRFLSIPFASPQLSRLIVDATMTVVEPKSWQALGGRGNMKYVDGKRFQVTQSQPNFRKLNQFVRYLSGAR